MVGFEYENQPILDFGFWILDFTFKIISQLLTIISTDRAISGNDNG
jgi:hypothetical protein